MLNNSRLSKVAIAVAMTIGLSTAAVAQETSSSIQGVIKGPQGAAAAGTVVTIVHQPSGTKRTVTVGNNGRFNAKGLRVGGPYLITADSDSFEDAQANNVFLSLGESYKQDFTLAVESDVERVAVTGRSVSALAMGSSSPSAFFNLDDLETVPSINRDLRDVIRLDPRISVQGNRIQCAGGNNRFNSLTVDGVRMNDNFGLNSSGYPTERMPFSFSAIDQVAVELAPFDVQYGNFTACNVNAVTKSGSNELQGDFFYDYTSDSMKGDSIDGEGQQENGNYKETRFGINLGGAILEDELFFFVSYESLSGANVFDNTPYISKVSEAEIAQIKQIMQDQYNYDAGNIVPSANNEDEKLLVKLDWNINDNHRASFVYNYNDGFNISQSDSGSRRLSFDNHFYERGAELNSFVTSIYSNWTEDFSTEVRVGYSELDNRQLSLDSESGFGEFQIRTDSGVTVYLGPDDSRQANKLKYDNLSLKLAGTYYMDDHELTFGYERETLDVFNLFLQHNQGEFRFSSIEDLANGLADRVYYGNTVSHDPNAAAGEFVYDLNTVYAQDTFELYDYNLTITAGLRYDWYTSDDVPANNPDFNNRYGFSNQQNLDGVDLLQPRLGLNWAVSDQLEIRGGIGLYSGGNPNVWVSNNYSNDGVLNIQASERGGIQLTGDNAVAMANGGAPGYEVTQSLYETIGDTSGRPDDSTNVMDPNFEIPSEWKYSLGATYITESDFVISADLLYNKKQNSAMIHDLAMGVEATAPDGRLIYDNGSGLENPPHNRENDFMLTNVGGDYSTSDDGESTTLSLSVSKDYDNGFSFVAGYAFNDATDVNPMTSSVAFSNYQYYAKADQNNPQVATSNYEVPHRFTLSLNYSNEFISGYETNFSLFAEAYQNSGLSYTFDNSSNFLFSYADDATHLLYIPKENDAGVVYADSFDKAAFDAWVAEKGLTRGEITQRNGQDGPWYSHIDIRVAQELPAFNPDHTASAFINLVNLGNVLNDSWGTLRNADSLNAQVAIDGSLDDQGRYVYESFLNNDETSVSKSGSLWEVRVGVQYRF